MNKNNPIEIMQVSNGFIVRPANLSENAIMPYTDFRVFQSMVELQNFIEHHFDFRNSEVVADDVVFSVAP